MDFGTNLASKTDPRATENPSKIVLMFELIFRSFFNIFCIAFGSQVGSNIHPKLVQKSIQQAIDLVIDFEIDLWSIFDGNGVQQRPAHTPKTLKTYFLWILLYRQFCLDVLLASFFIDFAWFSDPKNHQHCIPNSWNIYLKIKYTNKNLNSLCGL